MSERMLFDAYSIKERAAKPATKRPAILIVAAPEVDPEPELDPEDEPEADPVPFPAAAPTVGVLLPWYGPKVPFAAATRSRIAGPAIVVVSSAVDAEDNTT